MGILFTILMGIPFTITMGFLFTIVLGIQLTISILLDMMGRRRPFGLEGQLEMADDPIDNLMIIYERNY
jgi:hypothetical protein